MEEVLELTFRTLAKGPILFIRSPQVETFAVNPLGGSFAVTGRQHVIGVVFVESNATTFVYLFAVPAATEDSLTVTIGKSGQGRIGIVLPADRMVVNCVLGLVERRHGL